MTIPGPSPPSTCVTKRSNRRVHRHEDDAEQTPGHPMVLRPGDDSGFPALAEIKTTASKRRRLLGHVNPSGRDDRRAWNPRPRPRGRPSAPGPARPPPCPAARPRPRSAGRPAAAEPARASGRGRREFGLRAKLASSRAGGRAGNVQEIEVKTPEMRRFGGSRGGEKPGEIAGKPRFSGRRPGVIGLVLSQGTGVRVPVGVLSRDPAKSRPASNRTISRTFL
jgi:hypothetical protein